MAKCQKIVEFGVVCNLSTASFGPGAGDVARFVVLYRLPVRRRGKILQRFDEADE
jgi:hypothetical protein